MKQNNYCVIMAGGIGSRFWPQSRVKRPKQFVDLRAFFTHHTPRQHHRVNSFRLLGPRTRATARDTRHTDITRAGS